MGVTPQWRHSTRQCLNASSMSSSEKHVEFTGGFAAKAHVGRRHLNDGSVKWMNEWTVIHRSSRSCVYIISDIVVCRRTLAYTGIIDSEFTRIEQLDVRDSDLIGPHFLFLFSGVFIQQSGTSLAPLQRTTSQQDLRFILREIHWRCLAEGETSVSKDRQTTDGILSPPPQLSCSLRASTTPQWRPVPSAKRV